MVKLTPPKLSRLAIAAGDHVEQDAGEAVFRPFGQAAGHVVRAGAGEARQFRTQAVLRADVAGAAAGTDDHRRSLAVERFAASPA